MGNTLNSSLPILGYAGFAVGFSSIWFLPHQHFDRYFSWVSGRIQVEQVKFEPSDYKTDPKQAEGVLSAQDKRIIAAMRLNNNKDDEGDIDNRFINIKQKCIEDEEAFDKKKEEVVSTFDDEIADYRAAKAVITRK